MFYATYRPMELKVKLWLASDQGLGLLGEGRYRLLCQIGKDHSLRKAVGQLGVSYRKAWGDLRTLEKRLGFKLVTRQRGGSSGGTSDLTARARQMLDAFGKVKADVDSFVARQYQHRLQSIMETRGT